MKQTLEDSIYNNPVAKSITPEQREQSGKMLDAFISGLPHTETGELDYEQVGKLFGDACYGVGGLESTEDARAVFKNCMVQALFSKATNNLKNNPLAMIASGAFKSQAIGPKVAEFIAGFLS